MRLQRVDKKRTGADHTGARDPETPRRRAAFLCLVALTFVACGSNEQPNPPESEATNTFSNPIIPGFAPDPSIVRVEDDFYLINSSFEYFPGIPIYHSRDLVNWELISYALSDPESVELGRIKSSDGIHASTIRYNDGTYYIVTTNNVDGKMTNFIVTATDPRGPWSEPQVLEGAPGIDPSLLFDDDGRVWYVGNRVPPDPEFPGQAEIWLQEVDLVAMALIGERHYLWRGCCGGVWAEGPHIYKKDGYYYLMISEGGTSFEHAMAIAISDNITGPYRNNPRNPVLTHRQLSYDHPITGVGHADLVELDDGRWYAVALGWRLVDGDHGILGRETFLLPVTWETEPHDWLDEPLTFPVFSPVTGRLELNYPLPFAGQAQRTNGEFLDEFETGTLHPEWNFRRSPEQAFHEIDNGSLLLALQPGTIAEKEQYSFVGIRQRHFEFRATTSMRFSPSAANEEAGLTVIMNDRSAYLMTMTSEEGAYVLRLWQSRQGESSEIASSAIASDTPWLRVTGDYLVYRFEFSTDGKNWNALGGDVDGTALSPGEIGGFNYTGVYIGLFASANGEQSQNHAAFDLFEYEPRAPSRDAWYYRQASIRDAGASR